ncbi:MAG: DNA primase [Microgenomates group bacterium]
MVDEIEEIKRKIDIVEFISRYVPLKKAGRNFKALCPFHSEKTPSFFVSPERQIWHCFGACNEGGDIFKFLMKIENIEFGEALKELASQAGVRLTRYQPTPREKEKQILYEINHLAAEFYHYLLLNHPIGKKALDYIFSRGIKKESIEKFKIGYAPNAWEELQKFLVRKKGYQIKDLEKAGLIIPSLRGRGYYDRFRGRIIFPLRDHRGNICGFSGRVLLPEVKEAKYINTPETLIYHKSELLYGFFENKEEIKKVDEIILVEGEFDMISSWQVGVRNVVAIKGSALTQRQIELISRLTKNLTFALDSDIAGDQAARRGIEVAENFGMMMRVVEIKGGKDPDEVAQKNPLLWQKLVKNAVGIYDYFIDSALKRFDPNKVEGKRKIGEELVPLLAKISDKIVQNHYIKILAEKLKVGEEAIFLQIEKIIKNNFQKEENQKVFFSSTNRREILEEYLLALAFQSGKWAKLVKRKVVKLIKTPRFLRIIEALIDYLKKYKKLNSEKLASFLPPELQETFNRLYLIQLGEVVEDDQHWEKEFTKTLKELEKTEIKERMNFLAEEIKRLEKEGEEEKAEKLSQQLSELGNKLASLEEK